MEGKKLKRKMGLNLSMIACLFVLMITGCASNSGDKQQGNTVKPKEENEVSSNLRTEGYPIVEQQITLSLAGTRHPIQGPWEDMYVFKYMEQLTNMKFKLEGVPLESWEERKNLMFAGDGVPDVFFTTLLNSNDALRYGVREKMLMPLNDLIDRYMPNLKALFEQNPEVKKSITSSDGNIYILPSLSIFPVGTISPMWVNGDWLAELRITELPQTTEELYDLLVRFRDEDPDRNGKDDTIPLSSLDLNDIQGPLLAAFGHVQTNLFEIKDEKALFVPAEEGYKEYLKYVQRLFQEGLLDSETFTQTYPQMKAKGTDHKIGMFVHALPGLVFDAPTDEESLKHPVLPVLTSPINQINVYPAGSGITLGAAALSAKNPNPEASVRWIDYFYSKEGTRTGLYGEEGDLWEYLDKNKGTLRYREEGLPDGMGVEPYRGTITPIIGIPGPVNNSLEVFSSFESALTDHRNTQTDKLAPYGKVAFPDVHYTAEEFSKLERLSTDINTYVKEMRAQFVTKSDSIDAKWDAYVQELKKMGYEELREINQAAYDRWKNAD